MRPLPCSREYMALFCMSSTSLIGCDIRSVYARWSRLVKVLKPAPTALGMTAKASAGALAPMSYAADRACPKRSVMDWFGSPPKVSPRFLSAPPMALLIPENQDMLGSLLFPQHRP